MQHFVRFLVENWYILLEIFLLLLSVVFFILKKPTNKVVSGLFENLYKWCIEGIKNAETSPYFPLDCSASGSFKLQIALDYVSRCFNEAYPALNFFQYKKFIISIIEDILSTPTKKGGFGREKEVVKKS